MEYLIIEKHKDYIVFCETKLNTQGYFKEMFDFLGNRNWELVSNSIKTEGFFIINNGDGDGEINSSKERFIFKRNTEKYLSKNIEINSGKEFILNEIYTNYMRFKEQKKIYEKPLLNFLKNENNFFEEFFSKYENIVNLEKRACTFKIIEMKKTFLSFFNKKIKRFEYIRKIEILRKNDEYKINIYQKKSKNFSMIMSFKVSFEEICENPMVFKEIYNLSQSMDIKNENK